MRKYKVKEIFGPTIQGEGSHVGASVHFLRLSNCNKWSGKPEHKPKSICHYCDTDFVGGDLMTKEEIKDRFLELHADTVVISGGEPTLQIDEDLLRCLTGYFDLHLETNGSRALGELLRFFTHITCSPKQPYSETRLERCDDLKILCPYIHPQITLKDFKDFERKNTYLQPVMNENYKENLRETIDKVMGTKNVKLSLQVHKIIGIE